MMLRVTTVTRAWIDTAVSTEVCLLCLSEFAARSFLVIQFKILN